MSEVDDAQTWLAAAGTAKVTAINRMANTANLRVVTASHFSIKCA